MWPVATVSRWLGALKETVLSVPSSNVKWASPVAVALRRRR
jgi:hypothetical protein